jgi:hypothetical protein
VTSNIPQKKNDAVIFASSVLYFFFHIKCAGLTVATGGRQWSCFRFSFVIQYLCLPKTRSKQNECFVKEETDSKLLCRIYF